MSIAALNTHWNFIKFFSSWLGKYVYDRKTNSIIASLEENTKIIELAIDNRARQASGT